MLVAVTRNERSARAKESEMTASTTATLPRRTGRRITAIIVGGVLAAGVVATASTVLTNEDSAPTARVVTTADAGSRPMSARALEHRLEQRVAPSPVSANAAEHRLHG
jgi:hypothetical protein